MAKTKKPDDALVAEYMQQLEHPLKAEISLLRSIIKNAHPAICERIKWNAPSYFAPDDFLTFNPRMTDKVHLVFHHANIEAISSPILEGQYEKRRMVYLKNMDDVLAKQPELVRVIRELVNTFSPR